MPGAGSTTAGGSPAGFGSPIVSGPPRAVTYPRAIQFLAQQLGFPRDANGRHIDVHPIDQRVALKLTIAAGSLAGNPEMGNTIRNVRPGLKSTAAQANDAVRVALADELAANEIALLNVTVVSSGSSVFVQVVYQNLVTTQTTTSQAQIG